MLYLPLKDEDILILGPLAVEYFVYLQRMRLSWSQVC